MKLLLFTLIFSSFASAAPYYRFWRGGKLAQLTEKQYLNQMSKFVPTAPKLFDVLDSYLVTIPANEIGVDEVALLQYRSEEAYRAARSTPEGIAYGDSHWEIFERENSGSLVPKVLDEKIQANNAYDILQGNINWAEGFTTFYVGGKKEDFNTNQFINGLDKHVRNVRASFVPHGLQGYVILVTEDREYAFMNWKSKEDAQKAFTSVKGQSVLKEADGLLNRLQWHELGEFKNNVQRDHSYFVKILKPYTGCTWDCNDY